MGKKNSNTIEINGKRYDAFSGALLGDSPAPARSIDGMVSSQHAPAATHASLPHHPTVVHSTTPVHHAPKSIDGTLRRANHHHGVHRPQKGQTLMRHAVKRPAPGVKIHAVTPTDVLARSPQMSVVPKWSILQVDPKRLKHAEHVPKSRLIQRFAPTVPELPPTSSLPLTPEPRPHVIPAPAHHAAVRTPSTNRSMDVFQRALTHATAHEQPPHNPRAAKKAARADAKATKRTRKPVHHRALSVALASLAVLMLTGFFAYQNKANLIMRVADAKAGFHANLPGYKPTGFAAANFSYSPGLVAVNFHNATTGHDYNLVQKESDWDSQTLLDSYVSVKSHSYQTLQSGGRTIYLYGNNNAAWVNSGVLYQLTSDGNLTTNDVLNIATSV